MQNDMLKNNIAPWQEKGRWYHIRVKSDGTVWTILYDESDKFFASSVIASSVYLVVNDPLLNNGEAFIVDDKYIFDHLARLAGGFNIPHGAFHRFMSNTRQDIVLVAPTSYIGNVDIYLFITY